MIACMHVVLCDICGFTTKAKIVNLHRNEEVYDAPEDWAKGETPGVHICPGCNVKLKKIYCEVH